MTGPGEVFGTCYHGDLAGKGRKLWLEARHGLRRHSRRHWLWWWEQADKLALSEMTPTFPNTTRLLTTSCPLKHSGKVWQRAALSRPRCLSLRPRVGLDQCLFLFDEEKGNVKAGFCDLLADVRLSVRPVHAHICVCQPWSKGQTPTDHKPAAQKQQHIFFCGVFIWLSKHLCTIIFSTCFSDINQSFNWLRNHFFTFPLQTRNFSSALLMRIRGSYAVCVRNVEIELH